MKEVRTEALPGEVDEHEPFRRMPAFLGLASGPRNMPRSKAHLFHTGDITQVTVHALTDGPTLSRHLPPRCRLDGEPVLSVGITQLTNLGWLAGRGYNIVTVSAPVVFEGDRDTAHGDFQLCLWENMADPILTGREELGMPKLFADIPDPREVDGQWECSASWEGFPFLNLHLDTSNGGESSSSSSGYGRSGVYILHRYHPRAGEWGQADIDEIVFSKATGSPPPVVLEKRAGVGQFEFHPARWEDMPTQYTYVNALANLPLLEFRGGQVVRARGIGDLKAFRIAT